MTYSVSGLPAEPFHRFFGLSDQDLAVHNIVRVIAADDGAYPCRITLRDASPGESLLLLNYEHLPAPSPYRSKHAIIVNEQAGEAARIDRD